MNVKDEFKWFLHSLEHINDQNVNCISSVPTLFHFFDRVKRQRFSLHHIRALKMLPSSGYKIHTIKCVSYQFASNLFYFFYAENCVEPPVVRPFWFVIKNRKIKRWFSILKFIIGKSEMRRAFDISLPSAAFRPHQFTMGIDMRSDRALQWWNIVVTNHDFTLWIVYAWQRNERVQTLCVSIQLEVIFYFKVYRGM